MNHWARSLAALPAVQQRAIARFQRISLPRGADATMVAARLRQALCHAATVRATYALLKPDIRAAIDDLRSRRRGIAATELFARYGALRPLRDLRADPRPQSIAEHLVLLGWLVERVDVRGRPARWLLPSELRRWLPAPLRVPELGPSPDPPRPLALRATAAVLLACAARPLAVRADGHLPRAAERMLAGRLAPIDPGEAARLLEFILPLLVQLGLVALHHGRCELAPPGRRFLALSDSEQLGRLASAWVAHPQRDAEFMRRLRDDHGIDWPLLRRRLLAWAAALPADRLLDPVALAPALAATLGPLADAQTHGFRSVPRTPWHARRANAIFQAALRGPLAWLGVVAWAPLGAHDAIFRPSALPEAGAIPWRYGDDGQIIIPHGSAAADELRLLPFADWQAADAEATMYQLTPATIARAVGQGHGRDMLIALLEAHAGPPPEGCADLLAPTPAGLRLVHAEVLLAEQPELLTRAAQAASVRRALESRLAPGIALVAPASAGRLTRALARQGLAVENALLDAPITPPHGFSPGECAALLEACAAYRNAAPPEALPLGIAQIEARLRAGLPAELRRAEQAPPALALPPFEPPTAPGSDTGPPLAETLATLRAAIKGRTLLALAYDTAERGAPTWRMVRPLMIERHGDVWLLRAYCMARRAERTFRIDRIVAMGRE